MLDGVRAFCFFLYFLLFLSFTVLCGFTLGRGVAYRALFSRQASKHVVYMLGCPYVQSWAEGCAVFKLCQLPHYRGLRNACVQAKVYGLDLGELYGFGIKLDWWMSEGHVTAA